MELRVCARVTDQCHKLVSKQKDVNAKNDEVGLTYCLALAYCSLNVFCGGLN